MKILLVAERMHIDCRWEHAEALLPERAARWLEFSRDIGAFGSGMSTNKRDATRLASIGLRDFDALNLLPPSPVSGEWDARLAFRVGQVLRGELLWTDGWCYDIVVAVGKRPAAALGLDTAALGYFDLSSCGRFTTCPHSSGRNQWWNRKEAPPQCFLEKVKSS
jgi:hypothetical protein